MPLPCNWGWMAGTSTLQPLPCGLEAGLEPGCEPLSWICGKHWSRSCALPMAAPSAASQPCGCSGDHAADGAVRPPRSVPGPCTIPLPPLRLWVGRGCSCAPLSRSCGQLRSGGCVPPMTAPPPPLHPSLMASAGAAVGTILQLGLCTPAQQLQWSHVPPLAASQGYSWGLVGAAAGAVHLRPAAVASFGVGVAYHLWLCPCCSHWNWGCCPCNGRGLGLSVSPSLDSIPPPNLTLTPVIFSEVTGRSWHREFLFIARDLSVIFC